MPQRNRINNRKKIADTYLPFFLILIAIRLLITLIEPYEVDMSGYLAWSRYLADHGSSGLYQSFHIVYAPLYQYFLWFSGIIANIFHMPDAAHIYLIKLWPFLFECIGAWLIIRFSDRIKRWNAGMLAAIFYLFNPAIFINTSVWGQFDAIPATMLLGTVYLFETKKPNLGALLFLAAVLTKPQSGLLLPIVLYLYFRHFRMDMKSILRLITGFCAGIALYLFIVLPFYSPTGSAGITVPRFLDPFYWLFDLYLRSLTDYPYATANGMNFWMLAGGQIQPDTMPFMGLSYQTWGNIMLFVSVIYIFYLLYKGKGSSEALIYCSFLILFSAFMWMTKMHERYLLPAIIFIVLAAIWQRKHIITAILISICVFANQLIIYLKSFYEIYWLYRWDTTAIAVAALTFIVYGLALFNGYCIFASNRKRVIITKA